MVADNPSGTSTARVPMVLVRWKPGKIHVTQNGIKTICGGLIPSTAIRTVPTVDWHEHSNCYNCFHRLWPNHAPAGYLRPTSGKDFPLRRACPHGREPRWCATCTPLGSTARKPHNWPCPNGCADPGAHDPMRGPYATCTIRPPTRPPGADGRCAGDCESTELAMRRANPKLHFDLSDGDSMYCYHCRGPVCVACQATPMLRGGPGICDGCGAYSDAYDHGIDGM